MNSLKLSAVLTIAVQALLTSAATAAPSNSPSALSGSASAPNSAASVPSSTSNSFNFQTQNKKNYSRNGNGQNNSQSGTGTDGLSDALSKVEDIAESAKDATESAESIADSAKTASENSQQADEQNGSINSMNAQWGQQNPEMKWSLPASQGGSDVRDAQGNPVMVMTQPGSYPGSGVWSKFPVTPSVAAGWQTTAAAAGMMKTAFGMVGTNADIASANQTLLYNLIAANQGAKLPQMPGNAAMAAQAQQQAQGISAGNNFGDVAKNQAASAIGYCSKFMQNFTVSDGNQWNVLRNSLFVPIGILLLLPGAVLTQVKVIAAAGNPILDDPMVTPTPFDGIFRAIVAVFLIPATYLVINWGIDLSNSITYSIAYAYQSAFNSDMYSDAMGAQVKAFPTNGPGANQNTGIAQNAPATAVNSRATYEKNFLNTNGPDEGMSAGAMSARLTTFAGNAALTGAWNILCAFQMAYLFYLFLVGPVVAGLWVWPIAAFKQALPNWVEGVITLCFWSLFWNTTILLMACFKGVDDSGTIMMSALNFLATASIKYAFDFASLVKGAGTEATQRAVSMMNKGGGKSGGAQGGQGGQARRAAGAPAGAATAPGVPTGYPTGAAGGATASAGSTSFGAPQLGTAGPTAPGAAPADYSGSGQYGNGYSAPMVPASNGNLGSVAPAAFEHSLPPSTEVSGQVLSHDQSAQEYRVGNFTLAKDNANGQHLLHVSDASGHALTTVNLSELNGTQQFDFAGVGRLSAEIAPNGTLMTASADGTTDQLLIHSDSASDMHATVAGGQAWVELPSSASHADIMLSADGEHLSIRGQGQQPQTFDLAQMHEQQIQLGDGTTLAVHGTEGGCELTMANGNGEVVDNYSIMRHDNGQVFVGHADGHSNALGMMRITDNAEFGTVFSNFDPHGQMVDEATVRNNNLLTKYFEADGSGTVTGYMDSQFAEDGTSSNLYYDATGNSVEMPAAEQAASAENEPVNYDSNTSTGNEYYATAAGEYYASADEQYASKPNDYYPQTVNEQTSDWTPNWTTSAAAVNNYETAETQTVNNYGAQSTMPNPDANQFFYNNNTTVTNGTTNQPVSALGAALGRANSAGARSANRAVRQNNSQIEI